MKSWRRANSWDFSALHALQIDLTRTPQATFLCFVPGAWQALGCGWKWTRVSHLGGEGSAVLWVGGNIWMSWQKLCLPQDTKICHYPWTPVAGCNSDFTHLGTVSPLHGKCVLMVFPDPVSSWLWLWLLIGSGPPQMCQVTGDAAKVFCPGKDTENGWGEGGLRFTVWTSGLQLCFRVGFTQGIFWILESYNGLGWMGVQRSSNPTSAPCAGMPSTGRWRTGKGQTISGDVYQKCFLGRCRSRPAQCDNKISWYTRWELATQHDGEKNSFKLW